MEGDNLASSETPVVEAVESTDIVANPFKTSNGDLPQAEKVGKKEAEETTLDGEFIKVEKEALETKDASNLANPDESTTTKRSLSNSGRELLEAQENTKELELELERVIGALKHSEAENIRLKDEVLLSKEKLGEVGKKYEERDLDHKKLQKQIVEAEQRYSLQLANSQEALQAQEAKQKELTEVKEAFDGVNIEIENSRKRMQELEQDLQSSVEEARKFEELHKQSGSHAESETQRALEFERLLETAKLGAKEMEDQMDSLREEVKGLYEKVAENQRVDAALQSTTAELSAAQEELALSKSLVLDLEQRLGSKEALANDLTEELDLKRSSESKVKEEFSTLENTFAATNEDLQAKVSELEDIKLKSAEEFEARELIEARLKDQEVNFAIVQEELSKVLKDKEALETAVADLNSNAALLKELCSELEEKLKLSNEIFSQTDSRLSQALSNNEELEQKLKSLEELHTETEAAAATATQKNLELEDIVGASNEAAEDAKLKLRELEARFIAAEQRKVEPEQQLNLVELKGFETEKELKESSVKMSELTAKFGEVEEEKKQLNNQVQQYEEKINQLESALNQTAEKTSELAEELKVALERSAYHEDQANMNHQRSLDLEDLFQTSHSKLEGADKKVNEMELLLEAEKNRVRELEEQISKLEKKCGDSEAESIRYSNKVSELASELEAFQARASSLEIALQIANEKEKELTGCLNLATDEKKKLEEKLESIENDLKAVGLRESDVMEKLIYAEEQLEQQVREIEQAKARNSELESLHGSLTRDSEIKLQEVMEKFTIKDSEAKSLFEKLTLFEDQIKVYEEQVAQAAGQSASLKEQLDQSLLKLGYIENANEQLREEILEVENKAIQSSSENELLVQTNIQLKSRVDELQELLNSAVSEKERTAQEIASQMSTIRELSDQHTKASELRAEAESKILKAEAQLHEAIEKHTMKESEAKDLIEKLNVLESQIKTYEEQAHIASTIAASRQVEVEEALGKLKQLESYVEGLQTRSSHFEKESEGLAEANLKLTQELTKYESRLSDLEGKMAAALTEKDETAEQLHISKKAVEDLTRQITSEGQSLQTQVSSLMEENNLLNKTHQNTKKELQSVILQLEEQLKDEKENEESLKLEIRKLKAEVAKSSLMQNRVKKLEEQLVTVEIQLKEEVESVKKAASVREAELTSKLEDHAQKICDRDVINEKVLQLQSDLQLAQTTIAQQKDADSQKVLERDTALKHSIEGLEAKNKEALLLEKQVKELEHKLQVAEVKLKDASSAAELKDGLEVKSRDTDGLTFSTPSKRKSKKKPEASSVQATQTEASHLTPLNLFLGALVSIIIGIILGKRY